MNVHVAIVGLGYWGPNILKSIASIADVTINYCCDQDKKQLNRISTQYPEIKTTTNVQTVLADEQVDALIIATPSDTHFNLVSKALDSNKHVLVEKPMTLSVAHANNLVRKAKKQKKILMVGHTYEYHPAILRIKEEFKKGTLGDLFYIYCSRLNLGKVREETNALWNLAPHDVSILNYLIEKAPLKVSAFGRPFLQKKQEDVVFVNLLYPSNIIAHIHVSWLDPRKERQMTLVGSKRMISFDDMDNEASLKIYDKGFMKLVNEKGERMFKEFSLKLRPGDINLPYIEPKEPLREECLHFIECIKENKTPRSDGKSGLEVVRVLNAAQKSLDRGGMWVSLT